MPSSTTKAKREVAAATTAAAIKALSSSKPPTLRKKATTPPNKNKRGTPSKRNAAAVAAAEPEPLGDGAHSPFTSPSKRARTPQSNRYTEEARRQRNALLLADGDDDDVGLGRSTRLFASDDSTTTASNSTTNGANTGRPPLRGKDKEADGEAEAPLFKTPQKPKKEGSAKFGTPSSIQCSPSVKAAYSIVRRCTGSLGGNGAGGAIYGELTTGSMQKVVDIMISHCDLGKDSVFIDVGAGLGKPNIHVAQYPGVAASYGIEHEKVRWQLSLHNLKHLLQAAEEEEEEEQGSGSAPSSPSSAVSSSSGSSGEENKINHKIFFHYGDITDARTLDPFTHVYMFDIGFPPALFYEIADRFNRSRCPYLICYHGPRLIAERYGFEVELITQVQTSMHGSSEGHTAYFYKKKPVAPPNAGTAGGSSSTRATRAAAPACDPLFKAGLDLCKGPRDALGDWVRSQMAAQFASPRPARRRAPTVLFQQGDN